MNHYKSIIKEIQDKKKIEIIKMRTITPKTGVKDKNIENN